jgi:hypothetical protein
MQEAALAALRLAALLCTDALLECHANPPEALCSAAILLHDHALLVRDGGDNSFSSKGDVAGCSHRASLKYAQQQHQAATALTGLR